MTTALEAINRSELSGVELWRCSRRSLPGRLFLHLNYAVGAGIPLPEAMAVFPAGATERNAVRKMLESLRRGEPLSAALTATGGVFPEPIVNVVRYGENNGRLREVLHVLSHRFFGEQKLYRRLERKVSARIIIPFFLILLCLGVITFLMPNFFKLMREFMIVDEIARPLVFFQTLTQTVLELGLLCCGVWWLVSVSSSHIATRLLWLVPGARRVINLCRCAEFSGAAAGLFGAGCDWREAFLLSAQAMPFGFWAVRRDCDEFEGTAMEFLSSRIKFDPFELWIVGNGFAHESPEDGFLLAQKELLCKYNEALKCFLRRIDAIGLLLRAALVGAFALVLWTALLEMLMSILRWK